MKSRSTLRNTLGLILILVGLFLYLAFIERPAAEKKDAEETRSKQLSHFKVEEIEAVDFIKPIETITIQRDPKSTLWNITQPLPLKGEDGVINQLLVTLEEAQITRVVDKEPKNLEEFGLKDPTFKVVLHFKSGESRTLLMGDGSPIGHNFYIKWADEKRVLLSLLSKNHVNLPLYKLRSTLLLDFVPRNVTIVDLKFEKENQRIVKEGEQWKLTAPVNAQGDSDEISNFLDLIRGERIESFISETPENIASFGLESPRIVLNIQAEKAKRSWTLKIGKPRDENSYYAQRDKPDNIITVSENLVKALSRNPLSFMEKSLITFKESEVTSIESRDGKEIAHLVRDSSNKAQWKFKAPGDDTVDSAAVNTLLLDLQEARVQKFAPSKKLEPFGLDTPRKELTLFQKDGSKTTLLLGNSNKDKQHSFVSRSVDQSIIELDTDTVNKIFRSRNDFKNKKLLKFDPEKIARITIEYPDKTFELDKHDNQWTLIKPEKVDDLKPFAGKDILWTLNNLEYEAKSNSKEIGEKTGLKKPRLILTLRDRENNSLGQLKVGRQVKDRPLLYSQLTGDSSLYHIKNRVLSEIPDTLARFRKKQN